MSSETKTEISFSKKKIILILSGSLIFVLLGLWFVIDPPKDHLSDSTIRLNIIGYISFIFFGVVAVFCIKKIFDNHPALIFNDLGFDDRSSLFSAGFILWKDVRSISVIEIRKQRMIMLELNNPEQYIQSQNNFFKKQILKMNFKLYGAHLGLSSKGLDITFDELYEQLNKRVNK